LVFRKLPVRHFHPDRKAPPDLSAGASCETQPFLLVLAREPRSNPPMKILTIVLRLLLGLMFVVFGLNAFLNFMPTPPLPDTPAGNFISAMIASHYIYGVALFEIAAGLLLLVGRYVPLGLALLGPIVVNIDLYHLFMDPSGLVVAGVVSCIWLFLLWRYREAFAGLLRP
jgi:putative oxidoreductase